MDDYQKYIALSRYARWLPQEQRRENLEETVDRYINFFLTKIDGSVGCLASDKGMCKELIEAGKAIKNLEVAPSMRALMTAGIALRRDNVAGYNCSYLPIDHPKAFDEMMYILMCGTGVGFSVERQYINKLPEVAEEFHESETIITVRDSKIGWASAFRELVSLLYTGTVPKWDLSKVRPAGEPLKTFGGRASGPEPLNDLFNFATRLFKGASGRKLTSIECHDLCCKIAEIVVVGGVRRSALISLSNLTDDRMRRAKAGQWWEENPQRALANNSVCYTEKPDFDSFLQEVYSLHESKSGERGIFSRIASKSQASKNGRRESDVEFGTNPCSEIILRPYQFCNLSEAVCRPTDTFEDLKRKVKQATILGTLQSTLTDFRYLRKVWKDNTEEERLLGVSLTGIMDHPVLSGKSINDVLDCVSFCDKEDITLEYILNELKNVAIDTNKEWAKKLGIPRSTAITCVKPSGTVSQLVDSSSGIHPRFSPYYIRRVRGDVKDPLSQFLVEQGVPYEEAIGNPNTLVFSFPQKAPEGAICTKDVSAKEQLELWELYQDHYCEHKPSITIYYKDEDFLYLAQEIYNKFDKISGISLLPYSDHVYPQAPYEEIPEEIYNQLKGEFPKIDWENFKEYEKEDNTTSAKELACTAGNCEI